MEIVHACGIHVEVWVIYAYQHVISAFEDDSAATVLSQSRRHCRGFEDCSVRCDITPQDDQCRMWCYRIAEWPHDRLHEWGRVGVEFRPKCTARECHCVQVQQLSEFTEQGGDPAGLESVERFCVPT